MDDTIFLQADAAYEGANTQVSKPTVTKQTDDINLESTVTVTASAQTWIGIVIAVLIALS